MELTEERSFWAIKIIAYVLIYNLHQALKQGKKEQNMFEFGGHFNREAQNLRIGYNVWDIYHSNIVLHGSFLNTNTIMAKMREKCFVQTKTILINVNFLLWKKVSLSIRLVWKSF